MILSIMFYNCSNIDYKINFNNINNNLFKNTFQSNYYIYLFSLCDVIIVILQSFGIKIQYYSIFTQQISIKELFNKIILFIFFWIINLCFLFSILNSYNYFFVNYKSISKFGFLFIMFILIFKIHTFIQVNILHILGLFNYKQEFIEMFYNSDEINEYFGNFDYKLSIFKRYYTIINNIRKYIYINIFKNKHLTYIKLCETPYIKNIQNKYHHVNNKRIFNEYIDYFFRLLVPHVLTILMNNNQYDHYIISIILHTILSILRVYYMINMIIDFIKYANLIDI